MAGRKLIFTITTGRSGTAYLADLLKSNSRTGLFHHEIIGWDHFGVDTPDLSHMIEFNVKGNTTKIQDFWKRKFDTVTSGSDEVYCETSHVLAKCGLIENLDGLDSSCEVHIVDLQRNMLRTATSLRQRGDFLNYGNMWLWYLDPRYPKNITAVHGETNASNLCVWYVVEMRARAEYYRMLLKGMVNVMLHQTTLEKIVTPDGAKVLLDLLWPARSELAVSLPSVRNQGVAVVPVSAEDEVALATAVDAAGALDIKSLARQTFTSGFRF